MPVGLVTLTSMEYSPGARNASGRSNCAGLSPASGRRSSSRIACPFRLTTATEVVIAALSGLKPGTRIRSRSPRLKVVHDESPPDRDLGKETLAAAMAGEIQVHIHCYRADEMATMLDLAREFGFHIAAFHHGVEAYKLADRLASEHVCGALWADWWGFKMEALDAIEENIALVDRPAGGCAIVHSDSPEGIQRLNQEAAKALASGRRAGVAITEDDAIRWITLNPAWALGVDHRMGSLEPGKDADVVLWDRSPFSVYALAEKVWVDGAQVFERARPRWSDFELGQSPIVPMPPPVPSLLPGGAR